MTDREKAECMKQDLLAIAWLVEEYQLNSPGEVFEQLEMYLNRYKEELKDEA